MKLRAFISSTMEDLGNERRAVADKLRQLNIDPVCAEEMPPTGSNSWEEIVQEIKSCQIFILISGRTYGWIPKEGSGSKEKRSVTHMEFCAAKDNGLIILPFFMELKRDEKVTNDSKNRDAFRNEISEWNKGYFRKNFRWADELAFHVADAISNVLSQALRREFESKSAQESVQRARVRALPISNLHAILSASKWVSPTASLIAGAGMSIAAGFPTAATLAGLLIEDLHIGVNSQDVLNRHSFSEVAEVFVQTHGRDKLVDRISSVMRDPGAFGPTTAHLAAVRMFRTIVTTNFDQLFETACIMQNIPHTVIVPGECCKQAHHPDGLIIFKLSGSIELPKSLILDRSDVRSVIRLDSLWNTLQSVLAGKPLIIIGHSMRDEITKQMLEVCSPDGGAFVTPYLSAFEEKLLLKQLHLNGVKADADSFMIAYEQALANRIH